MNYGHWRYAKCIDCGVGVLTRQNGGHDILCKEHKAKRRADRDKRKHEHRYMPIGDPDSYIVIDDPDKGYGYRPGAVMICAQVKFMLLESYQGFTPGTILTNKAGKLFEIRKEGEKFRLVTV